MIPDNSETQSNTFLICQIAVPSFLLLSLNYDFIKLFAHV